MPKKDPCKVFACRIQKCLEDNKYQESACQHAIEDLHNCCRKWTNQSFVCEGIKIDKAPKKEYPRTCAGLLTAGGVLIFFSRPLYDLCFRSIDSAELEELQRTHKTRFGRS